MSKPFTDEEIQKIQEIVDSIPDYFDDVDEIQCPYCGELQGSFDSSEPYFYEEDGFEHTCDSDDCKKDFRVIPSCRWNYWTEPVS